MSASLPEPFSIRPSGDFEGNDGSWSTFLISVGNPEQNFHTLISTSSFSTWLPTAAGCEYDQDPSFVPSDCPALRGVGLTNGFQSTGFDDANGTFKYIGIHTLDIGDDLSMTDAFGSQYNATANLGLDTLKVQNGAGSEELTSKENVPVFGLTTWNFFLPSLGIGAGYLQSTTQESPSLVESLANQSLIPSRSWSYTAGASYRDYVGSLVLGGYDETRVEGNTTTRYELPPSTSTSELPTTPSRSKIPATPKTKSTPASRTRRSSRSRTRNDPVPQPPSDDGEDEVPEEPSSPVRARRTAAKAAPPQESDEEQSIEEAPRVSRPASRKGFGGPNTPRRLSRARRGAA